MRSPDERSDTRDVQQVVPAYRCAHAGYVVTLRPVVMGPRFREDDTEYVEGWS
jgi:hypothetical protein